MDSSLDSEGSQVWVLAQQLPNSVTLGSKLVLSMALASYALGRIKKA